MTTRWLRGMKARKQIKRACRRWASAVRALGPDNRDRGKIAPWREHLRYSHALRHAERAYYRACSNPVAESDIMGEFDLGGES